MFGCLAAIAHGAIYVGRHVQTGERVALKVLSPRLPLGCDVVRHLLVEREISRRVGHPGLVSIRDCAIAPEGMPYLVMDLIDGGSLAAEIAARPIAIGEAAAIGAQVADALAAMHAHGIVHCDLKPANVLRTGAGGLGGWPEVKVIDFGVAHVLDGRPGHAAVGTPLYMPPEQWRGAIVTGTDVYALGCLLHELLVGEPPFAGSVRELMEAHERGGAKPPSRLRPEVPAELDGVIARALATDPTHRPPIADLVGLLTALAFANPPGACSAPPRSVAC